MSIARPQNAALQVAKLVEDEERVVTGTAEVPVPGRALLLAMGRALGTVQVEDDAVRRPTPMHPVDPSPGEIRECGEVRLGGKPLGLKAAHLAGRGRQLVDALPAATETSLGEQQRVSAARALSLRPALALLDEPTAHQDDDHVELMLGALRQAGSRGTALLVATHDARVIAVADRVVRLDQGRVVA